MSVKIFLFIFLLKSKCEKDTMLLPFNNGKIIELASDTNAFCKARTGICISPSSDLKVKSCSDGKVVQILKLRNYGYHILIVSKGIYYSYAMIDTVLVKLQQIVEKGETIGVFAYSNKREPYIIFYVSRNKKEIDPKNFIVSSP